jgi:hypothetical protein
MVPSQKVRALIFREFLPSLGRWSAALTWGVEGGG